MKAKNQIRAKGDEREREKEEGRKGNDEGKEKGQWKGQDVKYRRRKKGKGDKTDNETRRASLGVMKRWEGGWDDIRRGDF